MACHAYQWRYDSTCVSWRLFHFVDLFPPPECRWAPKRTRLRRRERRRQSCSPIHGAPQSTAADINGPAQSYCTGWRRSSVGTTWSVFGWRTFHELCL